jgi:DNA-binding NtrC family response regulator
MPEAPIHSTILIVDDETMAVQASERALRAAGFASVATCTDSRLVMERIAAGGIATVILDLHMPNLPGDQVLDRIVRAEPDLPVIVVTGANDVDTAVDCIKRGAHDFILKPVDRDRLVMAVRHAIEMGELKRVNQRLGERILAAPSPLAPEFADLVTADPAMLAVFAYIEAVAPSSQPVLITGETGTGKELVAQALHHLSGRRGALVAVNVAGLDDTMFADTLFGHAKGAFTGADTLRAGLVENAADGTLFLDEIGDLAPASQIKLLRLIQEREYMPLGCDTPRRSTARVVAATSRRITTKPGGDDQPGSLRPDLYFRLHAHRVHLPPLRERLGDLRLLVPHFVAQAAQEFGREAPGIAEEVVDLLGSLTFPGNVRELRAQVFDAVGMAGDGVLAACHFRNVQGDESTGGRTSTHADVHFGRRLPTLKGIQDLLVQEVLRRTGGNAADAAALLGISRQALHKRMHP